MAGRDAGAAAEEELRAVAAELPPAAHAFAYGSGAFPQRGLPGAAAAPPVLDFILAVEDPVAWHAENLRRHRAHYSLLGALGPAAVAAVADRVGAGVYFNALVPWAGGRTIKYGVASLAALRRDLREWDALYLAGRMQKPVVTLTADARVEAAQRSNLAAALRAALLLLPERFSAGELRAALCALSYGGDVRVGLAEDAGKAARIAEGSAAALDALYAAPLAAAQGAWGALTRRGAGWEQDGAPAARAALVAALPAAVRRRLAPGGGPADAAAAAAAAPGGPAVAVRAALAATVAASSRRQAVAGLLSAGALRSARYLAHKLRRRWGAA